MKINIKATNIELTEPLKIFINQKIGELEKFLNKFEQDDYSEKNKEKISIWVEVGRTTKGQLKGDVYRAEAQFYLPKKKLRAVVVDQDLRVAINETKEELQRLIKKYKGKRIGRARDWARKVKNNFRNFNFIRKRRL